MYDMALDYEQEQRLEQGRLAEEERLFFEQYQEQDNRPVSFGTGQLCTCGMMTAEDCDCPF
jgi:hypothetical protein